MKKKRIKYPKIYKEGEWHCFRVTNSFGRREVVKSDTREKAQLKLMDMMKQKISSLSDEPTYKVTFEQGIQFWKKSKKNTITDSSFNRYDTYLINFSDFLKEKYPHLKYFDETQKDDNFAIDFRDYRLAQGRATKTIKGEEETIAGVYKLLIKKRKIPNINPFEDLESLAVVLVQERRVIPKDELKKFFEGAIWFFILLV